MVMVLDGVLNLRDGILHVVDAPRDTRLNGGVSAGAARDLEGVVGVLLVVLGGERFRRVGLVTQYCLHVGKAQAWQKEEEKQMDSGSSSRRSNCLEMSQ